MDENNPYKSPQKVSETLAKRSVLKVWLLFIGGIFSVLSSDACARLYFDLDTKRSGWDFVMTVCMVVVASVCFILLCRASRKVRSPGWRIAYVTFHTALGFIFYMLAVLIYIVEMEIDAL